MWILAVLQAPYGEVLELVSIDERSDPDWEDVERVIRAETRRLEETYLLPDTGLELFEANAPSVGAFFDVFVNAKRTEQTIERHVDGFKREPGYVPPPGTLRFCGRCGTRVADYPPGSVSGDDAYIHGVEQPADECYTCRRCGTLPSPWMAGTGRACRCCGRLSPFIVAFCGYCGSRLP